MDVLHTPVHFNENNPRITHNLWTLSSEWWNKRFYGKLGIATYSTISNIILPENEHLHKTKMPPLVFGFETAQPKTSAVKLVVTLICLQLDYRPILVTATFIQSCGYNSTPVSRRDLQEALFITLLKYRSLCFAVTSQA